MRNKKIFLNVIVSIILHITNSILALVIRKIFLAHLGAEVLGINSVFSSILAFLALSELGIGTIVSVCLYKPLAEKNFGRVAAYMEFLRTIYLFLGIGIFFMGVVLTPLVPYVLTGNYSKQFIYISFFIYLSTTASSYFFSYKRTLLFADQNAFVYQGVTIIFKVILNIGYAFALVYTESYYVYLLVGLLCGVGENLTVAIVCNRLYPQIRKVNVPISQTDKQDIIEKLKGMLSLRIGHYLINGADNIIISRFINTAMVTFYSNYYLIINMLDAICSNFASNVTSSLGNLIYTEREKLNKSLDKILITQYFIFGTTASAFFILSTDFIYLFFGNESVLEVKVVVLMTMVYYVNGYCNGIEALRKAVGLFTKDRFINLIIPIINIIISIALVGKYGVSGVLLGTLFCYFIQKIIVLPIYLASEIEEFHIKKYYFKFMVHAGLTVVNIGVGWLVSRSLYVEGWFMWFIRAVITVAIILAINIILFLKNDAFRDIIHSIRSVLRISKKENK